MWSEFCRLMNVYDALASNCECNDDKIEKRVSIKQKLANALRRFADFIEN